MASRFTDYQRRLFLFLSVATFFEGYDFLALSQILPNLRADMGLSKTAAGALFSVINAGTVVAYILVRRADRWGRRRVLTITIAGYTVATFLTGLAPEVFTFAAAQFAARTFLISEWAVTMVYAAEEFPAERRGEVIGIIAGFSSLGAIVCAGVTPLLLKTAYGWRSVYFVGIVPLALLAVARRSLRETRRFTEQVGATRGRRSLLHIFRTPYRRRVLELGAIWFLTYICNQNAVSFFKDFAINDRHMTDGAVGQAISVAALVSMPLVFAAGGLMDRIGRRYGALVILGLGTLGVLGCYTLPGQWPITGALVFGIFGASATPTVLNAFTTELFPTELRGDAFAWCNNLLGRIGYVLSPLAVGAAAEAVGWSTAVQVTAVFPVIAIVLVFALLPETAGRELEATAAL